MTSPATILLVRHGTNPKVGKGLTGWLPGVSLDENGRHQAETLAAVLSPRSFAAIYSSPLERTLETAAPLARRLGLEITPAPAFGEVRFGDWQGKDFVEIQCDPIWRRFNDFRSGTRAPGGELMLETQTRMVAGLLDIAARHPGQSVAVFSHADAIKSALCWILGIPLDFHLRLEILPASVTTVVIGAGEVPLVRSMNVSYDLRG
jgi:broad specificity phosphatase PhoE